MIANIPLKSAHKASKKALAKVKANNAEFQKTKGFATQMPIVVAMAGVSKRKKKK